MTLTLHYHPLSSYCWKVLVALYEREVPFTPHLVDPSDPAQAAALRALWPVGKFPVLQDGPLTLPETSIIIEHLDRARPASPPLIPAEDALQVRLWDRFFDLYVHEAMGRIVNDRLRPDTARDPLAVTEATARLDLAYAVAEAQLDGRSFAASDAFTLADCAAFPALFYAGVIHPFDRHPRLTAYLARLRQRPSVMRVLDEARPWFRFFPFADRLPADLR